MDPDARRYGGPGRPADDPGARWDNGGWTTGQDNPPPWEPTRPLWGPPPTERQAQPAWSPPPQQPPSGGGWGGQQPGRPVDSEPEGRRRGGSLLTTGIVSALVAAIVSAVVTAGVTRASDGGTSFTPPTQQVSDEGESSQPPAAAPLPSGATVGDIAEASLPSVARVDVRGSQGEGSGSAVVYSEDGYLVTNNHVVEGATELQVTLPDTRNVDAEVVGTDPLSDLAVLRIDGSMQGLRPLALAGTTPRVGDVAIAIGSPFGLESTVTEGIISATERDLEVPNGGVLPGLLQTDAAINPGNSGGALVNDRGELIGINTAILSESGTNSGVGFAVPVTTVSTVVPQLIANGGVQYAYLGVTSRDASSLAVSETDGAVLTAVEPGTPAAQAGLRQGDVVTAINGETVETAGGLTGAIRRFAPGDRVTITYQRDGSSQDVEIELTTRPDQ